LTNPESRSDEKSARRAQIDGSSTPLTRRQLREAAAERDARMAREASDARPRALTRRERIAAEAAASAVAASRVEPAAQAVTQAPAPDDSVPVVTTEIVIVPVAEPAPLTRRQLREREQQLRAREVELHAEEIADLEIGALGSGALEPTVELALEPVAPEAALAELLPTEPALHLAAPDAVRPITPVARTSASLDTSTPCAGSAVSAARAADAAPVRTSSAPAEVAAARASSTSGIAALTPAPLAEPFVARSASLALSAPSASDPGVAGGAPASVARASVSRFRDPSTRTPKAPRTGSSRSRGAWAKAGLTAVAMTFVLGITAVTAIPSTVSASPVDANVVNLSLNAGTAPAPQQLITASSASEVVNRDGYGVTDAGELQAAGYSTAQLLVGRSLAQELVNALDSGKLVGSSPDHTKEIRWIAQGVTVPDCGVDYRVLEIIAIAVRNFDKVGVSDINRKCTGQIEGAGTGSSHYIDGGGHAVDFYILDGKGLDGTDPGTLKLISLLDPVMPVGAHVGQAQCRAAAGIKLQLTNWTEFDDSCTHMHVDVPVTDAPLLLTDDSLLAPQ
jgi:hypothetical protein